MVMRKAASLFFAATLVGARAEENPIGKVLQLMSDLQAKILKEGEGAQKVYAEFAEWCEERSKELSFEIKTGKSEISELKATIDDQTSTVGSLEARLEELTAELMKDEADLKAATHIRDGEHKVFLASEKELSETIDTLQRAVGILEREMKGGASMMQLKSAGNLAQALSVLVEASKISTADAGQITALLQRSGRGEEEDVGAPAGAVYESHSANIVQVLSDLLEEAENQLDDTRKTETKDQHAFDLMQQSLKDEIKYGQKEIDEAKAGSAAAGEKKSKAQGELEMTSTDLAADVKGLAELHHECMTRAEDFEAETKSRGEELAAIAKAKEVIKENVAGAEDLSYGLNQVSLIQVARAGSTITSRAALSHFEAVRIVRALAKKHHSSALAQLAARMGDAGSEDQFGKVKGLIRDMIERLEKEADADAKKKAYCDTELSETYQKKADKTAEIEKLTSQIDKMSARSAQLKEEVAALQHALAELAKSQADMNRIRAEEKAAFESNSADMAQGLKGVKMALKVLREYYAKEDKAHAAAEGAGNGIINLLEVVESDFTKGIAQMTSDEESAQAAYEEQTKENTIEKTTKDQDVKYKTKESVQLDKAVAETSSDRSGVQEELDAALEYLEKLHAQCDEKADTYEERKARFEAEIAGLKGALQILQEETAFVQRGAKTTSAALRPTSLRLELPGEAERIRIKGCEAVCADGP
eukprot:CAMPEP_0170220870 /NCGR_PEP_ID=MMETSP0116_2-20130129/10123_1 /TAXON_ID=400756 /ORGANISM="Durinskia baltica, Strain CSIRO CS-38" /LENGTH=705 /DNA_ID=CAMNT_0010471549 /DNA_START=77 /DNA_END=2192 /DNA_ORIENTATION=+